MPKFGFGHIALIGGALLVGGTAMFWEPITGAFSYHQVPARVESVSIQCRFDTGGQDRDCAELAREKRQNAAYHDIAIHQNTIIRVRYISPADQKPHIGKLIYAGDVGRIFGYHAGGTAFIMAHGWNPNKIKPV